MALKVYARSWPITIISSFCVTIRPLRSAGEISAKKVGTVTEAQPTASPSRKRKAIITDAFGEKVQPSVAAMKSKAK